MPVVTEEAKARARSRLREHMKMKRADPAYRAMEAEKKRLYRQTAIGRNKNNEYKMRSYYRHHGAQVAVNRAMFRQAGWRWVRSDYPNWYETEEAWAWYGRWWKSIRYGQGTLAQLGLRTISDAF